METHITFIAVVIKSSAHRTAAARSRPPRPAGPGTAWSDAARSQTPAQLALRANSGITTRYQQASVLASQICHELQGQRGSPGPAAPLSVALPLRAHLTAPPPRLLLRRRQDPPRRAAARLQHMIAMFASC